MSGDDRSRDDFLVSSNPNDALIFSVNERDEYCTEAAVPAGAVNAESSCAATKTIEVCVNGVKRVVIIPQALSSNDVTSVSSATFLHSYLSSSSSASSLMGSGALDDRPDDVKLLVESCLNVSSSSSSLDKPAVFPAATSSRTYIAADVPSHADPRPYHLSPLSRLPLSSLPAADVPRNPYVAPTPPDFFVNSVTRAAVPSGIIPHILSSSFPAVPSLPTPVLPVCGFPPGQPPSYTMAVPTPMQHPLPFPADRNAVIPGQMLPGLTQLQQMHASAINQGPWTSYSPLQLRPPYGSVAVGVNGVNSMQPTPTNAAQRPAFDSSLSNHRGTNYQNFLPSLRSAITPDLAANQPSAQLQDYFLRKRAALQHSAAHSLLDNTDLLRHNYHMSPFDYYRFLARNSLANQRAPVNVNNARMEYPHPSHRSNLKQNSSKPLRTKSVSKQHTVVDMSHKDTVNNNSTQALPSVSRTQVSYESPDLWFHPFGLSRSCTSHHVASAACQTRVSSADSVIASQSVLPRYSADTACRRPVTCVPTDLQVNATQMQPASRPVVGTATLSMTVASTYITAVTRAHAAVESNSADSLALNTYLSSGPSVTSVPSNCSLTSSASLSNLLSTDLFPLDAAAAADPSSTISDSDAVLQNDTNDLESLPADVMFETSESESLLMSFCNMFEQSDTVQQQSGTSQVVSDRVKNGLENGEQLKETSVGVRNENAERGLQFAKSLGKGRHFATGMQQATRKRRRTHLTSLEVADESNSSDSWHPGSHSGSSDYQTASSPAPSTASSVSQSSDGYVATHRHRRKRSTSRHKRRRRARHVSRYARKPVKVSVRSSAVTVTQKCTVLLEQLLLHGQSSVNLRLVSSVTCCPQYSSIKPAQRLESTDSEGETADSQPSKKLRLRLPRIEDNESS